MYPPRPFSTGNALLTLVLLGCVALVLTVRPSAPPSITPAAAEIPPAPALLVGAQLSKEAFVVPGHRPELELMLGDALEDQALSIHLSRPVDELRVLSRIETSLTLTDEGAHRDLIDFHHGHTEWKELSKIEAGRFQLRAVPAPPYPFPKVSEAEIAAHVARLTNRDTRWMTRVKDAEPGPSRAHLKVFARDGQTWYAVAELSVLLPMGC